MSADGRELKHPQFYIEDHDEGIAFVFRVPGSKFGAVTVVLDTEAADSFAADIQDAVTFRAAEGERP
jgi:hypothetical protein